MTSPGPRGRTELELSTRALDAHYAAIEQQAVAEVNREVQSALERAQQAGQQAVLEVQAQETQAASAADVAARADEDTDHVNIRVIFQHREPLSLRIKKVRARCRRFWGRWLSPFR